MALEKNFKIPGVWAEDAYTTIPNPPVAGVSYRDEALSEDEIKTGQKFGSIGNSAVWNQLLWALSANSKQQEAQGLLSWSQLIDYQQGAWVLGSDGKAYTANVENGPTTTVTDPTTDTEGTWLNVSDLLGAIQKKKLEIFYTRTSGTFVVPEGVYSLFVIITGGGGSGANTHLSTTNNDISWRNEHAGGAGGCTCMDLIDVTPGESIDYVVGAGGVSPTDSDGPWGNGGATTFKNMTAPGGNATRNTAGNPFVSEASKSFKASGGMLHLEGGTAGLSFETAYENIAVVNRLPLTNGKLNSPAGGSFWGQGPNGGSLVIQFSDYSGVGQVILGGHPTEKAYLTNVDTPGVGGGSFTKMIWIGKPGNEHPEVPRWAGDGTAGCVFIAYVKPVNVGE